MHNEISLTNENIWQRISNSTNSVITPSNIIDGISLIGAKYSIDKLNSWQGVAGAAATFLPDLIDGKIARATGTVSKLGEKIDATGDKLKMAYALYKSYGMGLAPKSLIGAVAVRNGANALLSTIDQIKNGDDQRLHSSKLGKYSIFAEQVGVGTHIIASQMAKDDLSGADQLKTVGSVIGWAGVALGVVATAGYTRELFRPNNEPQA